jgi:hypothetical protein
MWKGLNSRQTDCGEEREQKGPSRAKAWGGGMGLCEKQLPLQGLNFSLTVENNGFSSPPVSGFGLLLNGCYLPEFNNSADATSTIDRYADSWRLTFPLSKSSSRAALVEMNGWWVVPAQDHGNSVLSGMRMEVTSDKENSGCLGGNCVLWRLVAAAAAVTTWSGHLHLAMGTRPPVDVRDERWIYDLRVRHFISHSLT